MYWLILVLAIPRYEDIPEPQSYKLGSYGYSGDDCREIAHDLNRRHQPSRSISFFMCNYEEESKDD